MAEIFIEGVGVFEIEGDEPNERETAALLEIQGLKAPAQAAPEPAPEEDPGTGKGPLGIVSPDVRESVRGAVEEQPGLLQLLTELSPSIGGAIAGAGVGAVGGPIGVVAGAAIGGLAGEAAGQEVGLAPASTTNLVLAGTGPIGGTVAGGIFKGLRRGVGSLASLHFAKAARARVAAKSAGLEVQSLGARILDKTTGLMSSPSGDLFAAARRAGIIVDGTAVEGTRKAIGELLAELAPVKSFSEVKEAIGVLNQLNATIGVGDISFDTLIRARQLLGAAVKRAESSAGIRFGTAKKAFKAIATDMDNLVTHAPRRTRRTARIAKAATGRAKLEFSVRELEAGVAQFLKPVASGEGVQINMAGFSKWLLDITNKRSKKFDKNFTSALADDLPGIKKRVGELAKILEAGSPGGPGSLVVRAAGAKAARNFFLGGAAGFAVTGNPLIGAAAGIAGASIPEILTAALANNTGAAILNALAQLGRGNIDTKMWALLGEFVARSAGEGEETSTFGDKAALSRSTSVQGVDETAPGVIN